MNNAEVSHLIRTIDSLVIKRLLLDPLSISYGSSNLKVYLDDPFFEAFINRYFDLHLQPNTTILKYSVIHVQDSLIYESIQALMQGQQDRVDLGGQVESLRDIQEVEDNRVEVYYLHFKAINRIVMVTSTSASSVRIVAMRLIRALFKIMHIKLGWVLVHAAVCCINGIGVGIVGSKRAGKTSTLLSLLAEYQAELISNDKVLVHNQGTRLKCMGLPHKVGIRPDVLNHFPLLLDSLVREDALYFHHNNRLLRGGTVPPSLREPKVFLLPRETADAVKTVLKMDTDVHLWIIPVWDEEATFAKGEIPTEEEVLQLLKNQWLEYEGIERLLHQSLLADGAPDPKAELEQILLRTAPSWQAYRVHQNFRTLKEASDLIVSRARECHKNNDD